MVVGPPRERPIAWCCCPFCARCRSVGTHGGTVDHGELRRVLAGDAVTLAYVDQGYTGQVAAEAAAAEGITLEVVKLPEAKRGFVLLPRRWVVERSFAWATRCRRLVKDYERYATTLAGFHVIASVGYMLKQLAPLVQGA